MTSYCLQGPCMSKPMTLNKVHIYTMFKKRHNNNKNMLLQSQNMNSWQKAKQGKLYSDLLQAYKRETADSSGFSSGDLNNDSYAKATPLWGPS